TVRELCGTLRRSPRGFSEGDDLRPARTARDVLPRPSSASSFGAPVVACITAAAGASTLAATGRTCGSSSPTGGGFGYGSPRRWTCSHAGEPSAADGSKDQAALGAKHQHRCEQTARRLRCV